MKKDFWEFDPDLNIWTQKTDYGGRARYEAIGFSIGSKGYIGTGDDPMNMSDFWEYTPDGFRVGLLSDNSYCAGSPIKVPFTLSNPCMQGNVFTAQLSDSLGNFMNSLNIGTLSGLYSDTINSVLPLPFTNGSKYRIRVASSDPSAISADNLYNLSIYSTTLPGVVSGGTTISLGFPTDTLKLFGNIGTVVKWQKQFNGNGYSDIPSTSGLLIYIETPVDTGLYNYRAIVRNGKCASENSLPTTVTVVSGPVTRSWLGGIDDNWNKSGNWSPVGVPSSDDNIIIPSNAANMPIVKNNGLSCNDILIKSGATLTVNPGVTITAWGSITIEGH